MKPLNSLRLAIAGNLLYILASLFAVAWLIGFTVYNLEGYVHILLILALVAIIASVVQSNKMILEEDASGKKE